MKCRKGTSKGCRRAQTKRRVMGRQDEGLNMELADFGKDKKESINAHSMRTSEGGRVQGWDSGGMLEG